MTCTSPLVLGIDAAWTETQPSGVALIRRDRSGWRVLRVAPSYETFLAGGHGQTLDWENGSPRGAVPDLAALLSASEAASEAAVSLVAVDMPLSVTPILGRRAGDLEISRRFGSRGCSTHSPSGDRPGAISLELSRDLVSRGFEIATAASAAPPLPCAIEVYPHPALLVLLGRSYRVPYKVTRSAQYWPGTSVRERIRRIGRELRTIARGLESVLGPLPFSIPRSSRVPTLAFWKRYEDALDALVSAWVGAMVLDGKAEPFGDEESAVWVPRESSRPEL